jgi:hypothetical protein
MDDVAGGAQVVGERDQASGQPLGVMEQQDFGHGNLPMCRRIRAEERPVVRSLF